MNSNFFSVLLSASYVNNINEQNKHLHLEEFTFWLYETDSK